MSEVYVNVGPTKIVLHNPDQHPLPQGAGQAARTQASGEGQVISGQVNVSGSIPDTVFNNPA